MKREKLLFALLLWGLGSVVAGQDSGARSSDSAWNTLANIAAAPQSPSTPAVQDVPVPYHEETPDPHGFKPLTVDGYFSCDIPPDWSQETHSFGLSDKEKGVYGIRLIGPLRGELSASLSVYYYAEGNLLYHSMDHYFRVFSQPALGVALEGSSYEPTVAVTVSGRNATAFERVKNEYVPVGGGRFDTPDKPDGIIIVRRGIQTRAVPVRERFVVVPAEAGFYALRFTAPAESFAELFPVFQRVTATFFALR